MPLQIYRASAGSGKTFNLTRTYLTLCLRSNDPYYYRRILALTFTNKASDEMKRRILNEFQRLSRRPQSSEHLHALEESTGKSKKNLSEQSGEILKTIMLNYHRFSIHTIDSFLQQITRHFMREIDLPAGYEIELDTDKVVTAAMDDLYTDLEEGHPLLRWIDRIVQQRLAEGKSFHFQRALTKLAEELFREDGYEAHYRQSPESDQMESLYESLREEKYTLGNKFLNIQEDIRQLLDQYEIDPLEFSYSKKGFMSALMNRDRHNYWQLMDINRFQKAPGNFDKWFSNSKMKSNSFARPARQLYEELNPILRNLHAFVGETAPKLLSLDKILSNFHSFAVLLYVNHAIEQYCRQNNTMLLYQTTRLLEESLLATDTPFLFERVGNRYEHILIDEFQDTSRMQWQAISPLVEESLAQGKESMIVGDVKQAIYRWRNGDWRLLHNEIPRTIQQHFIQSITLNKNWRSLPVIVQFNNGLYPAQAERLSDKFSEECLEANVDLEEVDFAREMYDPSTTEQEVRSADTNRGSGYVACHFYGEDSEEDRWSELRETIRDLYRKDYNSRDITILYRKNKEGHEIADHLLHWQAEAPSESNAFRFISDESLSLFHSPVIQIIIALFKLNEEAEDKPARAELWRGFRRLNTPELPSLDAVEDWDRLAQIDEHIPGLIRMSHRQSLLDFANQIVDVLDLLEDRSNAFPFYQRFQDVLMEYGQEEGNRMDAFLEYWEEEGFEESIQMPEHADAIRLMTVHKAKGLGFPVVLIPFASWNMNPHDRPPTLWCNTESLTGEEFSHLPVNYSSKLTHSLLREDYLRERILSYIDELNALYVATTRASERLYLFSDEIKKSNPDNLKINDLLHDFATGSGAQKIEDGDTKTTYKWGFDHFKARVKSQGESKRSTLNQYSVHSLRPNIRTRGLPESLSGGKSQSMDPVERGHVMHEFLAEIEQPGDVSSVVRAAVMNGRISSENREEWASYLEKLLRDEPMKSWFAPGKTTFVERDILTPNGSLYRPDRVILEKNETRVIDFKSGEERPKHRQQIRRYAHFLDEMGYPAVSAHLYYTDRRTHKIIA